MNLPAGTRVAIVGAASQIGVALVPKLIASGAQVACIGRTAREAADGLPTHAFDPHSGSFLPPLQGVDALVSLAPLPVIDDVLAMAQVLGARRVIAFGSTGRFSKRDSRSAIEQDFVQQQEDAERRFAQGSAAQGIAWTLFRPTMVYGAGLDQNIAFIQAAIRRFGFFPLPIGARGLRQPVHVNDLADACVAALAHASTRGRAYDLGGGEVLEFPALVRRVGSAMGRRPLLLPVPLWVYHRLIDVAQRLPRAAFVRREMVDRMYRDLTVDHSAAMQDFGYSPGPFSMG